MDILLWRWSTAVQMTSAFMIAVFFVVLSRSIRRPELLWWRRAWIANLAALVVTLVYWYYSPSAFVAVRLVYASYCAAKLAFVVLIVEGAWAARHSGRTLLTSRQRWAVVVVYALAGGLTLRTLMHLGLVQHSLIALIFLTTAFASVRLRDRRTAWLAAGLLVRGLVAVAEAIAYAIASGTNEIGRAASLFLSASSSFDTGAEWLLALGCVLVISDRIQRELEQSNRELLSAQDELRALADRDPLTALSNRRALPAALRNVQPSGATILFFDLDDFKEINDVHGHEAGDQCLKVFASALRASFRPDDAIVRYGGDEFLVIAPGLDSAAIEERIALVRGRIRDEGMSIPRIAFSVGRAELPPGGKPDDALRAADTAMYETKAERKRAATG